VDFFLLLLGDLVILLCSDPSDALVLYDAAVKLHKAMWRQDLGGILQDVDQCEGLKFLPAAVVNELQLRELGCNAKAILVREEYTFALKAMEGRQMDSGGIIVTGHPGIGTNLLQKDNILLT
jgi:hypothetical protein